MGFTFCLQSDRAEKERLKSTVKWAFKSGATLFYTETDVFVEVLKFDGLEYLLFVLSIFLMK